MVESTGGWWRLDGSGPTHGTDYGYRVDAGGLTPDPRSAWQPTGVHGPSRVFDPELFTWSDAKWPGPRNGQGALGGVLYELHVGTFTAEGTLRSAIGRLAELAALGVDLVQLMPLSPFEEVAGWGYDGVHAYGVHEPYGGPVALQEFVDAAHTQGLGVGLDVVYNHLGPSGNYLARYGPYFTDAHQTPWGAGINVDGPGNIAVRRWLIDSALRWFRDFKLDALRLDAIHEIRDDSPTHILAQLAEETHMLSAALNRPLTLIGESDLNDPRVIEPTGAHGLGLNAQWADDIHHALHASLTGERQGYYQDFGPLSVLAHTLTRVFRHDGCWSQFRGQLWGKPVDPTKHPGSAFVAYLQSHDQVGNRARGDRISQLISPGQQAIGAALILCSAFTPMLFMGEEWGSCQPWQYFTDFRDPDLAEAVRAGRYAEFIGHGWAAQEVPDPQSPGTWQRSVLRWEERQHGDHARMLSWYQGLIRLRHKELPGDDLSQVRVQFDEHARWFVLARGQLRVVANFAEQAQLVPLDGEPVDVQLCWDPASTALHERAIKLGPHGVAVIALE